MVTYNRKKIRSTLSRNGETVPLVDGNWYKVGLQLEVLERLDEILKELRKINNGSK